MVVRKPTFEKWWPRTSREKWHNCLPLQTVSPKFMGGYSAAIIKRLPAEDGINGVKTMSTFRMRKITVKNSCFQGAPTANLGSGILACFGVEKGSKFRRKMRKKTSGVQIVSEMKFNYANPKKKQWFIALKMVTWWWLNFSDLGLDFFSPSGAGKCAKN